MATPSHPHYEFLVSNRKGQTVVAKIDREDVNRVMQHKWTLNPRGYVTKSTGKPTCSLHRFILNAKSGQIIDHANHDLADCRKSNIRFCTPKENARNKTKGKNNTTGYKGVWYHEPCQKFCAQVTYERKIFHLGLYESPHDAALAYNEAARLLYGNFACLNDVAVEIRAKASNGSYIRSKYWRRHLNSIGVAP